MSKIVIHRVSVEQIVNLADMQVIRADDKNVTVRIVGVDWFVKRPSYPTLKALYALGAGSHIYANKGALIAVSAIVGKITDFERIGGIAAVMRDGQVVKVARRESAAFNRVYRDLIKKTP
jgi:hypothetical protein